jgi:aminoglycoside 6-adenylyltransferase
MKKTESIFMCGQSESVKTNNKSSTDRLYEQLVERFVKWAETCSDIRAAVIVGSRARVDHPSDEWADLDILVITTNPERYLSTIDWIENIGNPLLTFLEPTAIEGEMERRVLFEGMLDVDFSIFPKRRVDQVAQLLQDETPPQIAALIMNTFGRGMHVLVDKDGMASQLRAVVSSIETPTSNPPTQHKFLEVINDFLYHTVWTVKKLRRGELWTAKFCLDSYMKWRCILRMMEWHARATKGWAYNTWHSGRFLEDWADPRVLKGLRAAFAHYNDDDIRRALLATMDFFRWLAMETAEKLSYPYPTKADSRVTEWVKTCLSKKGE